ncbi:unnamed protein product [Blepharisma stoltei]|uniref:Uncharacterized protein n=1 Tax=Blepharisma stoltei TaxID=1481888 RepID=A0AAU9KCD3_9CILI|nr:unnamed protein product [Blepharisma stoltei]
MAGTNLALPFLMINLGGEMMYILNQRLNAQQIPNDKADKVRVDVIKHLFSDAFIDEMMRPQPLYTMISTRQTFDKLAHSSIMKLQTSSMNKLFDLMVMGVKMQFLCVKYPEEILQVTLNHLKELLALIPGNEAQLIITKVINRVKERYLGMSSATMARIRQTLLKFFQNKYAKVTLLLSRGIQLQDGTIKITTSEACPICETPGKIRRFLQTGEVVREYTRILSKSDGFIAARYESRYTENSTTLGFNLYATDKPFAPLPPEEQKAPAPAPARRYVSAPDKTRVEIAKHELNSLASMIAGPDENPADFFELNLNFQMMEVEDVTNIRQVEGKRVHNEELLKFEREFDGATEASIRDQDPDNLLDLIE